MERKCFRSSVSASVSGHGVVAFQHPYNYGSPPPIADTTGNSFPAEAGNANIAQSRNIAAITNHPFADTSNGPTNLVNAYDIAAFTKHTHANFASRACS